ncbi:MAG: pyruvate ferredoxin oxidoreductase, partial [Candidatus Methanomethylophilaceae archaeon]
GAYGALFADVCTTLIDMKDAPAVYNYIYGLGGKDAKASDFRTIFEDMISGKAVKYNFMGVEE